MIHWLPGFVLYGLVISYGCSWGLTQRDSVSIPSVEISGMAKIEGDSFLIVSDRKEAAGPGSWLSVLTAGKHGYRISPVDLTGFSHTDQPNDLEAVCTLPRGSDEFLLVESGYYRSKYGRILHIRLHMHRESWSAQLIGWFRPLPLNAAWADGSTPSSEQLEGIGCIQDSLEKTWIILGTRGSLSSPAHLLWGELKELESGHPSFSKQGEQALAFNPLGDRSISTSSLKRSKPILGDSGLVLRLTPESWDPSDH